MHRDNPYEVAFEAYLRDRGLGYAAVNETRRTVLEGGSVKSLDFIVQGGDGQGWLIDVKGHRFPSGSDARPRRVWECWVLAEDVRALERWESVFGADFRGLFVFAFGLGEQVQLPEGTVDLVEWQGKRYLFRGVEVATYRKHLRLRSRSWGTVFLPAAVFRQVVRPVGELLGAALVEGACPL